MKNNESRTDPCNRGSRSTRGS